MTKKDYLNINNYIEQDRTKTATLQELHDVALDCVLKGTVHDIPLTKRNTKHFRGLRK